VPPKKKPKKKRRKKGYHRGDYTSSKTGATCKFRSSWEEKYMIRLDEDPRVSSWSYEPFFIEYVSNKSTKKVRKYYPDFFVTMDDGSNVIVEIKQKRKLDQATVKKKAEAAERWCSEHGATYKILTEIELKVLGIL
jgi:hypothetical protein